MKISLADKGVWINRDNLNDVHIHPEGNVIVLAINDEQVYRGKACCPLALCMGNDQIRLQIRHGDDDTNVTFHDIDPVLLDSQLRGVLTTLAATIARK